MPETWLVPPSHRLLTPNRYKQDHRWIRPVECVILHFTAGYKRRPSDTRPARAALWLTNPAARASAHFVVDNPAVWQLAPLEDRCWHAGGKTSRFRGKTVNVRSIGIEIANLGLLFERPDQTLEDWWGRDYTGQVEQFSLAAFERMYGPDGLTVVQTLCQRKGVKVPEVLSFEPYTPGQVRAVAELLMELAEVYPILRDDPSRITTHDAVDPRRKLDTGPAMLWRLNKWRRELAAGLPLSFPPGGQP